MKKHKYTLLLLTVWLSEIILSQTINTNESLKYLALGDSYTIGESVNENERWPVQLGQALQNRGIEVQEVRIIARTGWRTDNLQDAIEEEAPSNDYNLVSLLIGVNNQYQGGSITTYASEFEELLQTAINLAGGDKSKVMVVSIPDYAYTPFGGGSASTSQEIDEFNAVNREITFKYEVDYHNITPISRRGLSEPNLVADDGLHPSGEMYDLWVEQIINDINFTDDTAIGNNPPGLSVTFNNYTLIINTSQIADLKIYTLEGKLILQKKELSPQQGHNINLSGIKAGIYLITLESNKKIISSGKYFIPPF